MNKIIEVTEKEVKAAFSVAKTDEVKKVLAALFCKPENKPNFEDYKSIKTYEDACEALSIEPIINDAYSICGYEDDGEKVSHPELCEIPNHIAALMKLETISKALWGKTFQPQPDADGSKYYYYPWFALYTKKEIEDMDDDEKGALLSADASDGALAGFGILNANYRSSYASAYFGFRLCQETQEKALYFGKQFAEIWADYLAFNFTVGERIK